MSCCKLRSLSTLSSARQYNVVDIAISVSQSRPLACIVHGMAHRPARGTLLGGLTDMCLTSPRGHRLTAWPLHPKVQVVEEAHSFAISFLKQLC